MTADRFPAAHGCALRVAMLAPFAVHGPKGTACWRVMPLARALAAGGHSVRVVVPPYDFPADGGRRWLDGGVEVVNVSLPRAGRQAGAMTLVARLVQAASGWKPDVVHSFKPKGYTGLAAAWLAQRGFVVVQDSDDWETGWNDLAGYGRGLQRLFAWQERRGLQAAAAVTVASRWLERLAIRLCGTGQGVFYLPNSVQAGRFAVGSHSRYAMDFATSEVKPQTKRVLLYTQFVETTPAAVWRVWSAVLARCPDAILVVVGAGGAGEEQTLVRLAGEAGGARSVVLLGWQQHDTLSGLLAAMDAAVFPAADTPLNRAKSPMRLLDALAAGVPVATQAVGEYGEYVIDGETGLVTSPGDAAALAGAVVRLLEDPILARSLADEAARRVEVDHSWPRMAEIAEAAYDSALKGKP